MVCNSPKDTWRPCQEQQLDWHYWGQYGTRGIVRGFSMILACQQVCKRWVADQPPPIWTSKWGHNIFVEAAATFFRATSTEAVRLNGINPMTGGALCESNDMIPHSVIAWGWDGVLEKLSMHDLSSPNRSSSTSVNSNCSALSLSQQNDPVSKIHICQKQQHLISLHQATLWSAHVHDHIPLFYDEVIWEGKQAKRN